ncbi:calcium-binding protein [Sphingomonas sp. LT1P40]|uniref:calcium-binding protein n=1 Tax=Alteristakelama amylovorans TaxID=3096166 RepID=UPI002FCC63DF
MLKSILLASAVMISAPALAQEAAPQETTPPAQEQTVPPAAEPTAPADAPAPADETAVDSTAQTAPAPAEPAAPPAEQPAQTAEQTPAPAEQPAQTAQQPAPAGQQPANAAQIAQVVDSGFPTYDKDADGNLKAEEFGAWMVALRSASEPAFTGQSAADKEWITRAWAAADKDKSNGINKDELKGFLAPAAAS